MSTDQAIRDKMLELTRKRGPRSSICPSEVVRALFEDWRPHMPRVREIAVQEALRGTIRITQKGRVADLKTFKGPIRLSWVEPEE